MKSKRERTREAWRVVLQRLADRLPDLPLEEPREDDPGDDDQRGSEIPSLTTAPIPE